jgi:deoxyribodipyrimidine photo-lyase
VSSPTLRLRGINHAPVRPDRDYVVYWMTAARRCRDNFGLDRAVDSARELGKPLVVLEALRCGYPWASDRLHRFVLDGMADNQTSFAGKPVTYYPYVEREHGAGKGLLRALGAGACAVVTDDFPAFFLPRMVASAARQLDVRLEAVDGNGLLPMRRAERAFPTAHAFRRFLHQALPDVLPDRPRSRQPWSELPPPAPLPRAVTDRWPSGLLAPGELPIDHSVTPVAIRGGERAAGAALGRFVAQRLAGYGGARNHPDDDASSRLSPYLHFGHLSPHRAFAAIVEREGWDPSRAGGAPAGSRERWWGMSASAEAFLDQLVTWRELGFNMCAHRDDYDRVESLPAWAIATIDEHRADERAYCYDAEAFERASTHDEIWNAAQRQLVTEGTIHNYMRMLWGKKIYEWSATPEAALEVMIDLNNKYALDGRDPNSYSGILWCLGRYDRAWGPERKIFGKLRYMTTANAARKLRLGAYLAHYGPAR